MCFQAGICPGANDPFIRWTYDKVGNRLSQQVPAAGTTTYTYDARDRLLSAGATSYTYDQNGNELSAGSRSFTYDLANRLKTTSQGSTTIAYTYNGDGVRLQASTGTAANKNTKFLWDVNGGLPQVALERDGNNANLRRYTYGVQRISMTSGANTSYYMRDGLGSTANLTSSTGATQWTWSYVPFGAIRTETKASGSQPENFMKFSGEYLDPTGLYHLRARQYDPSTGRFLQVDPVDATADLQNPIGSTYGYARGRPTAMSDPTGMTPRIIDVSESISRLASSSSVMSPVGSDNCTKVPDSIGVWVITLIDFSPSCADHDVCYGQWREYRRSCDDDFEGDMKQQCEDQYQHTIVLPWDRYGRDKCNEVADVYYWGVQQLGNLSWPKKAYRYDATARRGCPWLRKIRGGTRVDLPRCLAYVMDRSYPPYDPDVKTITAALAKRLAEIALPVP